MNLASDFLRGVVSALTISSPPLYRYPYRSAADAFRGDWKHIGGDIEAALQNLGGARAIGGKDHE